LAATVAMDGPAVDAKYSLLSIVQRP